MDFVKQLMHLIVKHHKHMQILQKNNVSRSWSSLKPTFTKRAPAFPYNISCNESI